MQICKVYIENLFYNFSYCTGEVNEQVKRNSKSEPLKLTLDFSKSEVVI